MIGGRWGRRFLVGAALVAALAGCADQPPTPPPAAPVPAAAPEPSSDAIGPHGPTVSSDPAALAREIDTAQATIADPTRSPREVAAAARTAQVAYEELAFHPERLAPVLAALPPGPADVTNRIVTAGRDLLAMAKGAPGDELPAWRIAEPLPPDRLRALYAEAEQRFGVPWHVLAAVNLVESRMGRIASHSEAGARGPMQFMPSTWASYGLGWRRRRPPRRDPRGGELPAGQRGRHRDGRGPRAASLQQRPALRPRRARVRRG